MNDQQPLFSLVYTSVRPDAIPQVIKLWNERSTLKSHEWCIGTDAGDDQTAQAVSAEQHEVLRTTPSHDAVVRHALNTGAKTCVAGWNAAASISTGKIMIAVADDFLPPENWDGLLMSLEPKGWEDGEYVVKVADGYNPDIFTLSILTRKRYERFGYLFYPKYHSMFCLPAEARIYMADFTFKSINDVKLGDTVVGCERHYGKHGLKKHKRAKLVPADVSGVSKRMSTLVEIELQSGTKFKCTPDHLWAVYGDTRRTLSSNGERTRTASDGMISYKIPAAGRTLVKAVTEPEVPPKGSERDIGWLAGIYDGEGHFPVISQSLSHNPEVCSEIERLLLKYGFKFSTSSSYTQTLKDKKSVSHQRVYTLTGGRDAYLKFLNWVRPVRTKIKKIKKLMFASRFGSKDKIIAVREISGLHEVFCLTTATGNYIANGYLSHNCDTEFGTVALRDGVVISAEHLLFEHMHPDCGKRPRDQVDLVHASKERWNTGEQLYNFRKRQGFPIDDGPLAAKYEAERAAKAAKPVAAEADRYVAYLQVTKDDICLLDVCLRLVEEGVKDFCFCVPDKYWSGEPVEASGITEINAVRLELIKHGVNAFSKEFAIDKYVMPGDSRILIETRVRNESLAWIRSLGYKHILIVDGDELWVPGTLNIIKGYVEQGHQAISVRMIPVIGLPGYPVEGATDVAVVYIGGDNVFKMCRSPYIPQTIVYRPLIYHFTGTRKDMPETIVKHRRGGHYDDPDYDFEGWIKETLPNIKPGLQGAHMFKPRQIWKEVRAWRPEELAAMPDSVRPYLGAAP